MLLWHSGVGSIDALLSSEGGASSDLALLTLGDATELSRPLRMLLL
jgi:hypothetical protein